MRVTVVTLGEFGEMLPSISLNLYRIAQEALQNAARHANAALAEVELARENDAIRLSVRDHGVGMPPNGHRTGKGLGLVSIRERTNLLRGTLTVDSVPGRGTTITVRIDEKKWRVVSV